jgi:hypothetical protein
VDLDIKLTFFQGAVTVLPTIFIAFSLTSHLLDPVSRRNLKIHFVLLSGKSGLVTLTVIVAGFIAAEMMTLIVLATETPTFPVFVVVIFFVFLFAWFVALQALNPLLQDAAAAAEREASGEAAKAAAIGRYRLLGNWIIIGSFVCFLAGSVIFYVLRAQH